MMAKILYMKNFLRKKASKDLSKLNNQLPKQDRLSILLEGLLQSLEKTKEDYDGK